MAVSRDGGTLRQEGRETRRGAFAARRQRDGRPPVAHVLRCRYSSLVCARVSVVGAWRI